MKYFDNAATTLMKPPTVAEAVCAALSTFGGAGRGVHGPSLAAGRSAYEARAALARLLDAPSPRAISFTLNATMALNIALQGLVLPGTTVVTTAASHNSVLRPLFRLRDEAGCTVEIVPVRADGSLDFEAYVSCLQKRNVSVVVATHASNVTGDIYDVARMAHLAHESGALFILDAAQTAGSYPLSMRDLDVDVLCFTGHKSLMGPQGTGGLCVRSGLSVPPLLEGGSGVHSYDERHPQCMPEALEAGTINAHGIAGLGAALRFLEEVGVDVVHEHIALLTDCFEEGARTLKGVRIWGGHHSFARSGIVALGVDGIDAATLADKLAFDFDICTRAGAHCAPLMHQSLGTQECGVVRFSFSYFNTKEEITEGIDALEQCIAQLKGTDHVK